VVRCRVARREQPPWVQRINRGDPAKVLKCRPRKDGETKGDLAQRRLAPR